MIPQPSSAGPPLRPPSEVMRLSRLGAAFPTRLSFMRSLIRRLQREQTVVRRPVWQIDAEGHGRAVYQLRLGGREYALAAFSTPLDDDARSDRVIAEAWDTSYVLTDGVPSAQDLARLEANAPRQEAGRYAQTDLVLSRANKSLRLFAHVVDRLAAGRQPDPDMIRRIGYLMRTTAVYGNGKFGIADRALIAQRPELSGSFQAEMLAVWLIRGFTLDLAEHMAKARAPGEAVGLSRQIRRHIGVGNATGLGMAPFLVTHPVLLNNWIMVRETALARVRAIPHTTRATAREVCDLLARAEDHVAEWTVDDARQSARIAQLRRDLAETSAVASEDWLASAPQPWDRLWRTTDGRSEELRELIFAVLLEPHADLVDELTDCMTDPSGPRLEPAMRVGRLEEILRTNYAWALAIDFDDPDETAQFWYVSEEKAEPRLGNRRSEPGAEREMALDIARQAQSLGADLMDADPSTTVAAFLLRRPEHRELVRRVQSTVWAPYAEIHDNLIGASCLPIDLLRAKLALFGASKFDPRSDRWTRVTLFQGAPGFDEVSAPDADDWAFPALGQA